MEKAVEEAEEVEEAEGGVAGVAKEVRIREEVHVREVMKGRTHKPVKSVDGKNPMADLTPKVGTSIYPRSPKPTNHDFVRVTENNMEIPLLYFFLLSLVFVSSCLNFFLSKWRKTRD